MKRIVAALVISGLLALPLMADAPQPFLNAAVTTAVNVKTAPGSMYGFVLMNTGAATCFLQIFNTTAANVTLGTTVPVLSIPVSVNSATVPGITALSLSNSPMPFNVAMSVAATTSATGGGTCAAMVVNILFL